MFMPPLIRKVVPGDVIGRCRIIREIGRGGVGTVYLASHQTLKIDVALKILSPSLSLDNPALGERFIREAQLAARIRHPNVIAVMDAALDEPSGAYFIVMEYIGGGSLAWQLRNGPLPEARGLAIVTGITQALIVAEDGRIVHRDIKPENILLDARGTPKLADLGLAKHVIDTRASITLGGSFMGTPAYMSPEQARDAKVADTRDDIYSLGATFYECLTGVPPFQGETPYNIMSELLTKPTPRPRDLRPELMKSTDLICRKMMAKSRDLRYATARELMQDLLHVQQHGDAGFEQLHASQFERDAEAARQQELQRESRFGIETSSDGVYVEPPDFSAPPPPAPPPRRDRDVYRAAALLLAIVLVTTLIVAWAGTTHPFSALVSRMVASPTPTPTPHPATNSVAAPAPHAHKHERPPAPKPVAVVGPMPLTPSETVQPAALEPALPATNLPPPPFPAVSTTPVALPVDPTALETNPPPAVPAASLLQPGAEAPSFSAFAARDVAERSLDPALLDGTGHAELLRIIGKRDANAVTPGTWTYLFYDKTAAGHARIVTVTDGRVVKMGEDLVDSLTPYSEQVVLPESAMQKDSGDVLEIARALVPEATITGSEFLLLQQKNSVPMWRVTLWGKTGGGEEQKIGEITLLAESGTVISRNLKPAP
jgi:serine/threonine protein kinase